MTTRAEAEAALRRIAQLAPGWDSYHSLAIDPAILDAAGVLLASLMREVPSDLAPFICPTPRGGIQLEWHCHEVDVEIDISTLDEVAFTFVCRSTTNPLLLVLARAFLGQIMNRRNGRLTYARIT